MTFSRLFTCASALALLLCVGVAALWFDSYRGALAWEFDRGGKRWRLASDRGRLTTDNGPELRRDRERYYRARAAQREEQLAALEAYEAVLARHGDAQYDAAGWADLRAANRRLIDAALRDVPPPRTAPSGDFVSYSSILAAAAVLPGSWLGLLGLRRVRAWRLRRDAARRHLCRTCGYDVRATPYRCPECGQSVTHAIT